MAYRYERRGEVRLRPDREALLQQVDAVVFDVDGVLVDVKGSFPHVIADTTQFYFERILRWPGSARLVEAEETALYKQAGGFNSDWRLARACVLTCLWKAARAGSTELDVIRASAPSLAEITAGIRRHGGGMAGLHALLRESEQAGELGGGGLDAVLADWDEALIDRICCEHYGGDDLCEAMYGFPPRHRIGQPGLINREEPLLQAERLNGRIRGYGLYTGRTDGEIPPAFRLCGITDKIPPEFIVSGSSRFHKPDPGGLAHLAAVMGLRTGCFAGDNIDDLETVLRYENVRGEGEAPFVFAGILGGAPGEKAEALFEEGGADIIVPSVNVLLDYLNAL